MNKPVLITALLCCAAIGPVLGAEQPVPVEYVQGHAVYGQPMPVGKAPMPLAQLLVNYESNADLPVLVSGKIGEVCQKKGCWMMLTDEGIGARVRFGDHAFAIPKDSGGKAVVLGTLRAVEMSEKDAKHMARDAGKDPAKVSGPQAEWELMATSVLIMADR